METPFRRDRVFADDAEIDSAACLDGGRGLARSVRVGRCPFLAHYAVADEAAYKRRAMAEGRIMLHAQIGYRDRDRSRRAWAEIYRDLERAGFRVDRYGICLDWSMGYPPDRRGRLARGTGLILETPEDFAALTAEAPVAPHFGDFVIGLPAALENTAAALQAGATVIGNLGQYFTFRMPAWDDDVGTTAATVGAMALVGAQPVECLVHSNLDDGFAAQFTDLACTLGAVLIERYIVEELIGARLTHCYGNSFSDGLKRLAFLFAIGRMSDSPGSMVYGNTVSYGADETQNWANLSAYLLVDVIGQRLAPTGHALNPVPVTEAQRIPDIEEIVAAHLAANRLIERAGTFEALFDDRPAREMADAIVAGGMRFRDNVLDGLDAAGFDTRNPGELLLAIRRIGAKRLEAVFGPGPPDARERRGRRPLVAAPSITEVERMGAACVAALDTTLRDRLAGAGLAGVVVSTDVHEYGKMLIENVLDGAGIEPIDGGTHADIDRVVAQAALHDADFIAVSTYNGVALDYLTGLRAAMRAAGLDIPVFIGGKLNQVPDGSNTSLPVDVTASLAEQGAIVCARPEEMLVHLAARAHANGTRREKAS
jgi:methylmalonyl-CoA mutase cobalamin-binding subunit